ncbi:hypothetical protein KO506_12245 [Polaribacter vadi]|uniref:hypothetical protein n=1 Tax=Polaribacter TaxID=52959 RepID=UPI001C08F890|nr:MULTISPECIES: hypothetical protein [Polaribacter]MBU3012178.1 hypothetical protein [Polaribacter vadi]MDO6741994.1 hypothetical protein [Polaribacter sp. 1_MG-2023]
MKHIFFAALLLVNSLIFSQGMRNGGGGMNQQNRQGETREVKEFKASEAAGIFYYETDVVIKKIKVKDDQLKIKVKKVISNYNFKVKEIAFLNSVKFSDLNVVVNTSMSSGNREEGVKMREKVEEVIKPVKEEILIHEEELNKNLENILSEKQFKKWVKYQKNKRDSLEPKKHNNEEGGRGRGERRQ